MSWELQHQLTSQGHLEKRITAATRISRSPRGGNYNTNSHLKVTLRRNLQHQLTSQGHPEEGITTPTHISRSP